MCAVCVCHKLGSSCHERLFEGITALKRIQMGDGDDDGALYGVACGVCVRLVVHLCTRLLACICVCYVNRECVSERG